MIYQNISELIGNTPIVRLNKMFRYNNVFAKLESFNPIGSIKDRTVFRILKSYIDQGKIKKGGTIIEATSGNTGIALACLSNYFGLHPIVVMPRTSSYQRKELVRAYGGELILVDGGMKECKEKVNEIKAKIRNCLELGQFESEENINAHYENTAREIEKELKDVDVIICGIGTGGTITGIGKYYKNKKKKVEIIGVEPSESPLITKGKSGNHLIQGIGANFIPPILDLKNVDRVINISYKDARMNCKTITMMEGYLVGLSSGAVLEACNHILEEDEYKSKNILLILPDTGERYSWD
jgi:cysteine synthase A